MNLKHGKIAQAINKDYEFLMSVSVSMINTNTNSLPVNSLKQNKNNKEQPEHAHQENIIKHSNVNLFPLHKRIASKRFQGRQKRKLHLA